MAGLRFEGPFSAVELGGLCNTSPSRETVVIEGPSPTVETLSCDWDTLRRLSSTPSELVGEGGDVRMLEIDSVSLSSCLNLLAEGKESSPRIREGPATGDEFR